MSYVINQTSLSVFILILRCPVENLPTGRYFDLPWRDRSRSFVMRPFCDFSNKLSKLHDSSKLKFCCLQKLAQKAVYLLIVNWACSQTLYLLFRDRGVFIALFIFSRVLRSFSHARFTRTLDKKRARTGYVD